MESSKHHASTRPHPPTRTRAPVRSEPLTARSESVALLQVLGEPGTLELIDVIEHEGEGAFLANFKKILAGEMSQGKIVDRLSKLRAFGIVLAKPQQDPTQRRLVLRYMISPKGRGILDIVLNLSHSKRKESTSEKENAGA